MKKARLFTTLLLSALMVFGVFGLTSFAADTDATAHKFEYRQATTEPYVGGVAFYCKNASDHGCEYSIKDPTKDLWYLVKLYAQDTVKNGEYDGVIVEYAYANGDPDKDIDIPGEFGFGDLQFQKDGTSTWSDKAPTEAGTYNVKEELLVNGDKTGCFVQTSFTIYEPKVTVNSKIIYGQKLSPKVEFTNATDENQPEKDDYVLEYKTLDGRLAKYAKYTKIAPIAVGNYRVRATFNNGGTAEADFAIVKNTSDELGAVAFSIAPSEWVSKLKDFDYSGMTMDEIRSNLVTIGVSGLTYIGNNGNSEYGKPIVFVPYFDEPFFVADVLHYGSPVYKYIEIKDGKESGKSKLFVPGVTILKKGTYKISYSIPATRNHVAASGSKTVNVTATTVKIVTEPKAKKNLVFDDTFQKLITPGTAKGATFTYAVVEKPAEGDATTPEESKFSKEIPTARAAGDYVVFWKLTADDNHTIDEVTASGKVEVSIAAVEPEDDPEAEALPNVKNVKVKAGKRSFKVSWTKLSAENRDKIDRIEVQYTTDPEFKTGIKTKRVSKTKTSFRASGLKRNKDYYVRVRTVKYNAEDEDGTVIPKKASAGTKVKVTTK